MSPVSVKVGGVWKDAPSVYTKVGGAWKTAADMPVKVGGVWKTGILSSGAFEPIATATPSGTGSVTFSSIPQTYQHLQVRISFINSGTGDPLYAQMNGITTTTYRNHHIRGSGTGVIAVSALSAGWSGEYYNGGESQYPSVQIWDIHDYASTTKNKVVRVFSGVDANGSGGVFLSSGLQQTTSAITSLRFYLGLQTFASGTTFALYGVKGA